MRPFIPILLMLALAHGARGQTYFPPPDSQGGWRTLKTAAEIHRIAGVDPAKLDEAFDIARQSTKNGGLLVVRRGYLVYERYFGLASRDMRPNLASVGKSFTSIAVGILIAERPDLFPDGLDQKIFTPKFLPPEAFPLADDAMAEIKLGHLLAFTAGIRGNNPSYVHNKEVTLDPAGPDGAQAMRDLVALGKQDAITNNTRLTIAPLWCKPGQGYSYATCSIHIASIMLRHVTGKELEQYLREKLATPMGWSDFGFAYRNSRAITHTPGGGGITLRSTDVLRFGYLLLHEGQWNNKQLVPNEYVRHARTASPYNPHYPYSLQFDVNATGQIPDVPRDAFWKSGSGGHVLYVVPSLDLVVWKLAGRDGQYQESDTGVPLDPAATNRAAPRANWKPTLSERDAQRQVLHALIESIQQR